MCPSCSSSKILNSPGINETVNCVKCKKVEKQLQQLAEELSSAYLIIQMLEKESRPEDAKTTWNQHEERNMIRDWEVKLPNGNKGSPEGKRRIRITEGIRSKRETVEMKNRFSVLTMEKEMQITKNKKLNSENLSRFIISEPEIQTKQYKRVFTDAKSPQKVQQEYGRSLPNLHSKSETSQQKDIKEKGMGKKYKIPTIINGRISSEATAVTLGQGSTPPKGKEPVTRKQHALQTHIQNKILLLGDSHIKGLAERMSSSLGNSFNVIGITKPNANIKGITSPNDSSPVNLTKQDMIIFCGGTKDISRNESKTGLRTLQEFAKRTSSTNVILLEAPTRYDLPLSSCVNTEVKLFNKRMRGLMTPFSHIKVMSMSTERGQHTRHGLHLTKKAKNFIADNLVKEIRKPHQPFQSNPPIAVQWKVTKEEIPQQTIPGSPTRIYDKTDPSSLGESRHNGRRVEEGDELKQQPAQTPQQTQPNIAQQHFPWSSMNTDQVQLGTGAQNSNITEKSAKGARPSLCEEEESSEKGNQLQEVRTSNRLRKQPGKMDTFLWSTR